MLITVFKDFDVSLGSFSCRSCSNSGFVHLSLLISQFALVGMNAFISSRVFSLSLLINKRGTIPLLSRSIQSSILFVVVVMDVHDVCFKITMAIMSVLPLRFVVQHSLDMVRPWHGEEDAMIIQCSCCSWSGTGIPQAAIFVLRSTGFHYCQHGVLDVP
jgi:hypothetical protein